MSTGRATTIGLTGPPGVGKSTLIGRAGAQGAFARQNGRRGFGRSRLAVFARRAARRPHSPDRALHRQRRLHSLDGQPRTSRRRCRRDRRRGVADGCVRPGRGDGRDGRRRSERDRDRGTRRKRRSSRCSRAAAIRFRCSRPASWKSPTFSWSTKPTTRWPINCKREIRSMMEMLDFAGWVPELVDDAGDERRGDRRCVGGDREARRVSARERRTREKRREAFTHQVRQLALGHLERRLERELREPSRRRRRPVRRGRTRSAKLRRPPGQHRRPGPPRAFARLGERHETLRPSSDGNLKPRTLRCHPEPVEGPRARRGDTPAGVCVFCAAPSARLSTSLKVLRHAQHDKTRHAPLLSS